MSNFLVGLKPAELAAALREAATVADDMRRDLETYRADLNLLLAERDRLADNLRDTEAELAKVKRGDRPRVWCRDCGRYACRCWCK